MMQKATMLITGRIAAPPRFPSPAHPDFFTLNIEVTEKYKDRQDGSEKELVSWFDAVSSKPSFTKVVKNISSGDLVSVAGKASAVTYVNRENITKAKIKINIQELELISDSSRQHAYETKVNDFDQDIPFN